MPTTGSRRANSAAFCLKRSARALAASCAAMDSAVRVLRCLLGSTHAGWRLGRRCLNLPTKSSGLTFLGGLSSPRTPALSANSGSKCFEWKSSLADIGISVSSCEGSKSTSSSSTAVS